MEVEILNCLNQGIIIFSQDNHIQFCNKDILKKTGYSLSQITDLELKNILEIGSFNLNKEEAMNLLTIDNRKISVIGEAVPAKWKEEEVFCIIIKEYKEEHYTLKDLELILENMPYAIWICDVNGNYRYINHNAISMAGKARGYEVLKEDFMKLNTIESWCENISSEVIRKDEEILRSGNIINQERWADIGGHQVKYYMIKIPITDKNNKYNGFICITQYDVFEEDMQKTFCDSQVALNQKYISDELKEMEDIFKFNNVFEHILEAEMVTILKYHKERDELQGVFRLGNVSNNMLNINEIKINCTTYMEMLQKDRIWTLDEFEKAVSCKGIGNLREKEIRYLYLNKIEYNNEILGALIATYKYKLQHPIMERELQKNLCKYTANMFKNNQLSKEIRKEFNQRQIAEEELRMYLNLAVDFIFTLDEEGRAIKWNDAWHTILGWDDNDIKKITYSKLCHPEDYKKDTETIAAMKKSKETAHFTNRYRHKNGSYRLLECTTQFDEENQQYFGIAKDITEERRKEEERKAYKEALQLETLKTEFLANMSHELKTPLNIIYSMIQLTELEFKHITAREKPDINLDNLMRYKNIANQNVYRLIRLINNITDISRIGAGYYETKLVNCNMIQVVEDITMSVVEYVKNKKLNIIFDTEVEELIMACDPEKMERIMLNLLSNAVKYTNEGDNIWVSIKVRDEQVQILVADNGIGIPREKQEVIFERFVQVDTSFTRKCEGTGIGLALVKSLIEQQKGNIKVQSTLDKGSLFTVSLPIYQVEETREIGRREENIHIEKCRVEFSDIYDI